MTGSTLSLTEYIRHGHAHMQVKGWQNHLVALMTKTAATSGGWHRQPAAPEGVQVHSCVWDVRSSLCRLHLHKKVGVKALRVHAKQSLTLHFTPFCDVTAA